MVRELLVFVVTAGVLGMSRADAATAEGRLTQRAAIDALHFFESVPNADFDEFLRQLRQPAPSPTAKAMVIRSLPERGALTPTAEEAAKLNVIRPVLVFHQREQDIELRLFTVGGMAFVGLHGRTVLLFSREALAVLEPDEILAIVAHELGHDYVWNEYEEARQRRDHGLLQELELRCDGIAVIALQRLRLDPERLVSALTKLARHNERLLGTPIDPRYVPLDQRVRFIRAVAKVTSTHVSSNR